MTTYKLFHKDTHDFIAQFDSHASTKEINYAVLKIDGNYYKPYMYSYDLEANNCINIYCLPTSKRIDIIDIEL